MTAAIELTLGSQVDASGAKLTTLSGDSPDAYNDVARPNRVIPQTQALALSNGHIELPPHSVAIAQFGS